MGYRAGNPSFARKLLAMVPGRVATPALPRPIGRLLAEVGSRVREALDLPSRTELAHTMTRLEDLDRRLEEMTAAQASSAYPDRLDEISERLSEVERVRVEPPPPPAPPPELEELRRLRHEIRRELESLTAPKGKKSGKGKKGKRGDKGKRDRDGDPDRAASADGSSGKSKKRGKKKAIEINVGSPRSMKERKRARKDR